MGESVEFSNVFIQLDLVNETAVFLNKAREEGPFTANRVYGFDECLDIFLSEVVSDQDREMFRAMFSLDSINRQLSRGSSIIEFEFREKTAGAWFVCDIYQPQKNGIVAAIMQDINSRKQEEDTINYRLTHDLLTGLYNRSAFEEKFTERMTSGKGSTGALCVVDLDNLKVVNDTLGHRQGDLVLKRAAEVITGVCPEGTVAGRFGGDEFILFVPGESREQIKAVLDELLGMAKNRGDDELPVTLSIGAAFLPSDGDNYAKAFEAADIALYHVKKEGKNGFCFYRKGMDFTSSLSETKTSTLWRRVRAFAPYVAALALTVALIVCGSLFYYNRLSKTMEEESFEHLNGISKQINEKVIDTINLNFVKLAMLENTLGDIESPSSGGLQAVLTKYKDTLGFKYIGYIDAFGKWHVEGMSGEFGSAEPLEQLSSVGQAMFPAQSEAGDKLIVYGISIDSQITGDEQASALIGIMDAYSMSRALSMSAYDTDGSAQIIDDKGYVVLCSEPESCVNALDMLDGASFLTGSAGQVRADMLSGRSGSVRFMLDDHDRLMSYSPFLNQGWYLLSSVPADVVKGRSRSLIGLTGVISFIITLLFIILICAILFTQFISRRKLMKLAFEDDVTHGPNRSKFISEAENTLKTSKDAYAVMVCNVDGFKLINDKLGKERADKVLCQINRVINMDMKRGECMGRIYADHFAVLVSAQPERAIEERFLGWTDKINSSEQVERSGVTLKMTYGIYFVEDTSLDVEVMLDRAEIARAYIGAENYMVYDDEMNQKLHRRKELEDRMDYAISAGEFFINLQPKYRLSDKTLSGAEALVRWHIPGRGTVYPDEFIPLFEQNGFVIKLDLYVFEKACSFVQRMIQEHGFALPVSINVSRCHLSYPDFLDDYYRIWEKYGIPAELIELEFTESVFGENLGQITSAIDAMHELGFKCSMDDFGSGYSTLHLLQRIKVDVLKLDKEFMSSDGQDVERQKIIIETVIRLAKNLGIHTVAEGVEREEQVEMLDKMGCELVQGYYFAKPIGEDQMERLITSQK